MQSRRLLLFIIIDLCRQIGIGSLISTRTIRILEDVEEAESQRKTWWKELRTELHQQCTSLGCDLIIAYAEHVAIHDGVILLGCSGTAVLTGKHQATFYLSGPRGSSTESDTGNAKELAKAKKVCFYWDFIKLKL